MEGLLYQVAYALRHHRTFLVALDSWVLIITVAVPLLAALGRFPGPWSLAVTIAVAGAALTIALAAARQRGYIRFIPEPNQPAYEEPVAPLEPEERVPIRATGTFAVSGMHRYRVEVSAAFTTFETREHALLAQVPHSHLLFLAWSPRGEVGWWYIFFRPEHIQEIVQGEIWFGLRRRPALKIVFQAGPAGRETVYLSFDDPQQRRRVLADLRRDAKRNA
jgi:hypothetical protein